MKRMKKVFCIPLLLVLGCFLTGCGNTQVLHCTMKNKGNNMNAYGDIKYTFKDDKVASMHSVFDFKDITVPDIDSVWSTYVEQFTEQNKPLDVAGYKRTVKSDDKKHVFTVIIDMDVSKLTDEVKETYDIDMEEFDVSYDEMKKSMLDNEDTISCK